MSTYYFDNTTKLFYCTEIHGNRIPVNSLEVSEEDFKYLIERRSQGSTIEVVDGVIVALEFNNVPTLTDKKQASKPIIDSLKSQREQQGFTYQFGNVQDVIQIRDERDLININGVVTTAMLMKQMNSEETLSFIAASNTTYQLTPDEVIQMGLVVSSFISSLTTKARQYKDAIDSAKSKKAVDDILASVNWD